MNDRILHGLSILSVLIVLIVVLMGALVTNTGSAYGCGNNWPLCYGQVIPTAHQTQTWIEFSHRVVSGLASILVVIQAVWVWIRLGKVRETKFLAISSVFFFFHLSASFSRCCSSIVGAIVSCPGHAFWNIIAVFCQRPAYRFHCI
ncbi:COX15/CtaA family protein [Terrilactibacillus sp. S3-3]|nr:COX15/CtaA family protein [Terrilactibacillus sp. S3-3]